MVASVKILHVLLGKSLTVKRKRDIQGKFALKNHDYRQVHSLRLTDKTWEELGVAAESLGITRADLLENLVQQNKGTFSDSAEIEKLTPEINQLKQENQDCPPQKLGLKAKINLNRDELNLLAQKVLQELRLGKQASSYKLVQKSLKRLIELILLESK